MRKKWFALICLIYGFISAFSFGQQIYTNRNVELYKLDEDFFLLKENTRWTANILAISGTEGILLMDTGFAEASGDLADAVNFLGKDVTVIINSHFHFDHTGGNEAFGKGVRIIGHSACMNTFPKEKFGITAIDKEYSLDFSGNTIRCIPFPGGHSECDIIVYIPSLKMAYLGDLYLSESFPLVNIGAGSKAQNVVKYLTEVHQIFPIDTRLFSGHGKETNMSDLANYIEMLETTIELVKVEMEKGKNLENIKNSDILNDFGQWGKFFDFITKETWIEQIHASYK